MGVPWVSPWFSREGIRTQAVVRKGRVGCCGSPQSINSLTTHLTTHHLTTSDHLVGSSLGEAPFGDVSSP